MNDNKWLPTFLILLGLWSFKAQACKMSAKAAEEKTKNEIERYLKSSRPTLNKVLKIEKVSSTSVYATYSIGENRRRVKRFFKLNIRPDCTASLSIGKGRAVAGKAD